MHVDLAISRLFTGHRAPTRFIDDTCASRLSSGRTTVKCDPTVTQSTCYSGRTIEIARSSGVTAALRTPRMLAQPEAIMRGSMIGERGDARGIRMKQSVDDIGVENARVLQRTSRFRAHDEDEDEDRVALQKSPATLGRLR